MEAIGVRADSRPTVGHMMVRDIFVYMALSTPAMLAFVLLFMSSVEYEDPSEVTDLTPLYIVLGIDIVIGLGMIYWRWNLYSSVLQSGVETSAEVTSVTKVGDTTAVEWTYRWQAETVKSAKLIGGFIPKKRLKYDVGLKDEIFTERFLRTPPQQWLKE